MPDLHMPFKSRSDVLPRSLWPEFGEAFWQRHRVRITVDEQILSLIVNDPTFLFGTTTRMRKRGGVWIYKCWGRFCTELWPIPWDTTPDACSKTVIIKKSYHLTIEAITNADKDPTGENLEWYHHFCTYVLTIRLVVWYVSFLVSPDWISAADDKCEYWLGRHATIESRLRMTKISCIPWYYGAPKNAITSSREKWSTLCNVGHGSMLRAVRVTRFLLGTDTGSP